MPFDSGPGTCSDCVFLASDCCGITFAVVEDTDPDSLLLLEIVLYPNPFSNVFRVLSLCHFEKDTPLVTLKVLTDATPCRSSGTFCGKLSSYKIKQ